MILSAGTAKPRLTSRIASSVCCFGPRATTFPSLSTWSGPRSLMFMGSRKAVVTRSKARCNRRERSWVRRSHERSPTRRITMTHSKRVRTGLGIVASALVAAAPVGATTITVVRDVSARDTAISNSMKPIQVVRDVSVRDAARIDAAMPVTSVRDVAARDARLAAGERAVAYFKAKELSTLVDSAGPAAIAYFKANERATMSRGGETIAAGPETDVRAVRASRFDWVDAGVGASSALLLSLLVGVSLLAARHFRSESLAS